MCGYWVKKIAEKNFTAMALFIWVCIFRVNKKRIADENLFMCIDGNNFYGGVWCCWWAG